MANALSIAVQGKGVLPLIKRAEVISNRYGFTPAKMSAALQCMLSTVAKFGCKATLPITAMPLVHQSNLGRMLRTQGIECAIHGLRHVDHTQLPLEQLVLELRRAVDIFSKAGIEVKGFRSPYLRWSHDTIEAVKICGLKYDSSNSLAWDVIDNKNSAYSRALEFYGAQSASQFPALPRCHDGLVRIPYSLPDDEALIERLAIKNERVIGQIWLAMLDIAFARGQLFTLGLHPERAIQCRQALQMVLVKANSLTTSVWLARLDEIANWQLKLAQFQIEIQQESKFQWRIAPPEETDVKILARSVRIDGLSQVWTGDFQLLGPGDVNIYSPVRPMIGLAPECPDELVDFLRQQGYLLEINENPSEYAYYLDMSTFQPQDELPLLTEIDQGNWPLIRVARWPRAARAALAITGDVDAITLWDFVERLLRK